MSGKRARSNGKYITDPTQAYALELTKLQRCFLELMQLAEAASELQPVGWMSVWYLRQLVFLLLQAEQVAKKLLGLEIGY